MSSTRILLLLTVLLGGSSLMAADLPSLDSGYVASPPKIDGKLDDDCWKSAAPITEFWLLDGSAKVNDAAQAWVANDQSNLYFAFRSKSGVESGLRSGSRKRDQGVWSGPNLQIFVDPSGPSPYYCFTLNSLNTQEDARSYDTSWNGRWKSAVDIAPDDSSWTAEIALPFPIMDLTAVKDGRWRLNVTCVVVAGGKQQVLTWSPAFNNFNAPQLFGNILLPKVNWDEYKVSLAASLKPGKPGTFEVSARTKQLTGKPRAMKLRLDFQVPSGGDAVSSVVLPASLQDVQTRLSAKTFESGEHEFILTLADAKTGKGLAEQWVNMQSPEPVQVWTDRSLYTNGGAARISLQTWIADVAEKPFTITVVDRDGSIYAKKSAKLDERSSGSILIDLKAMPVDEFRVRAEVAGKSGQCPLYKLAPQSGTVYYDDRGVIYKDSKPFFPFGMYYIQSHLGEDGLLEEYTQAGFNTIVWEWVDAPNYVSALKDMDKHGICLIASVQNEYYFSEMRMKMKSEPQDVQLAAYEKHVQSITKTVADSAPMNLLAWYVWDEPSLEGVPFVRRLADAAKAGDPRRPTLVCLHISNYLQGFTDIVDILAPDPYPGFPGGPITKVSNYLKEARRVTGGRKPVIAVLQSFSEPPGKDGVKNMPTPQELRCMTYLSLIHGAKGILYFSYDWNLSMRESNPKLWAEMKRLAWEVRGLSPALLADTSQSELALTSGSDAVHARLIRNGKSVFVIAVNTDRKPAKASWKLNGVADGPIGVIGEFRSTDIKNGRLADDFPPLGVRVYRRK